MIGIADKIKGSAKGFSLVELLMVMGTISILAGIGLSGAQGLRRWLSESETTALFSELETACRLYRLEKGKWPESLMKGEIQLNGSEPHWREALGPYMEGRAERTVFMDGYGNEDVRLLIDDDGDHWIKAGEFSGLQESSRPQKVWAQVLIYSLDENGRLAGSTWKEQP